VFLRRPPVRLAAAAALSIGLLAGCDIPTSVPSFDTEWEVLLARDTVAVEALLPPELTADASGFGLASFVRTDSVRLDEVCELCTCFDGPIPGLDLEPRDYALGLPARLVEAPLSGGSVTLGVTNGLGFDLLDDGAGGRGELTARLIDRRTRDTLIARSWTSPFPPGETITLDFPLDGVLLSNSLVFRVSGSTPGSRCEDLTLDPSDGLDVAVELLDLRAPSATILLVDADLAPPRQRARLPGPVADRLRPGEADLVVRLDVGSTLALPVDLDLSVAAGEGEVFGEGAALTTPVRIAPGSPAEPLRLRRDYVVDPALLFGRDSIVVAGRTSLSGGRLVTVRGDEAITWDVRLLATVPSR
jgi:hypothetical protein